MSGEKWGELDPLGSTGVGPLLASKIERRWRERWQAPLRIQFGRTEGLREIHKEALQRMLKMGIPMRAVRREDLDDPQMPESVRKELVELYGRPKHRLKDSSPPKRGDNVPSVPLLPAEARPGSE